jgi:hypothetical protein
VGLSGADAKEGGAVLPLTSVVTVCMNRREHLLATAPRLAAWPHHDEHLIVDWSSQPPLRRDDLPDDPRLRLLRVEGESRWNLCRAYNFAVARARGDLLLKLDADAWPTLAFDPQAPDLQLPGSAAFCAFGSGPEGRKGQLLISRHLFEAVGGFHELMEGYGFDDKDLHARLELHSGQEPRSIPSHWLEVIRHGDEERAGLDRARQRGGLEEARGEAAMRATRLANRLVAAHCPWGPHRPAGLYHMEGPDLWRLVPDSRPQPPAGVRRELEHERRMTFWGRFLGIPEASLEVLPYSLFPPSRDGRWRVRWWHRLWWHSGRRLLQWPVRALVKSRDWIAP